MCQRVWHHQCYRVHPERYEWLSTAATVLTATAAFAALSRSVGRFSCASCLLPAQHAGAPSFDRIEYMRELIVGAQCSEMHAVSVNTQSGYVGVVKKADNFFEWFGVPVLPMHGAVTSLGLEMFMQHHSRVGGTRSGGRGLAASTLEGVRAGVAHVFSQFGLLPPFSSRAWSGLRQRIGTSTVQAWSMTMSVVREVLIVLEFEFVQARRAGDVAVMLEVAESQLLTSVMWFGGLRGNEPMMLRVDDLRGRSGSGIQSSFSGGAVHDFVLLKFRWPTKTNRFGVVTELPIAAVTGSGVPVGAFCARCVRLWEVQGRTSGPAFLSVSGRAGLVWGTASGWCKSRLQPRVAVVKESGHADLRDVEVSEVHDNTFRRGFDTHAQDSGVHPHLIEAHQKWRAKGKQLDRLVLHYDRTSLWRALFITEVT